MNLVFDIGFNKGQYSKEILNKYPNCRIIGIEANNKLIHDLGYSNIILINALVSNKDNEKIKFYIEDNQDGISTASEEFIKESRFGKGNRIVDPTISNWNRIEFVKTITLDTLIKMFGTPDLIKLDIEGYEYIALSGLTSKQKMISFEWCEEIFHIAEKSVNHLMKLGYNEFCVTGYFEENDIFEFLEYDQHADTFGLIPKKFFNWSLIQNDLKKMLYSDRRMNYGMIFAK